ncbi:hypothetical protein UFOVP1369_11 [uncultured Caudovirales phage]|uniref:Uncharacterized protein n=1 Tax=uncultured Caudovirales phage TaxID=2100421 RepID=A0A6J5RVG4_9CAUD|nr:hypothetical protein UFOVP1369_11 [uncultured Caudovirales phage]
MQNATTAPLANFAFQYMDAEGLVNVYTGINYTDRQVDIICVGANETQTHTFDFNEDTSIVLEEACANVVALLKPHLNAIVN